MNENSKVFEASDFDAWSKSYDESVKDQDSYPFAAYDEVVKEVLRQVSGTRILDLGFGTGNVTAKLYALGSDIVGYDFSQNMVNIAKERMPKANLNVFDFSKELPEFKERFDCVVMTYVIHHFSIDRQIEMITELMKITDKIVIGDVITLSREEMDYAQEHEEAWDDAETYIVVEELQDIFDSLTFTFLKKSYCSGVLVIENKLVSGGW